MKIVSENEKRARKMKAEHARLVQAAQKAGIENPEQYVTQLENARQLQQLSVLFSALKN